jgi:hypothetical protein
MPFEKTLPEWNAAGVEPPQSLKDAGWAAEQKPPADYFNWYFNLVYNALKELQEKGYTQSEIDGFVSSLRNDLDNVDITADSILTKIKTVDGAGSGLDADTLDGKHASDFAASGHTHNNATQTNAGFMSSADKAKVDGIEASAQKNTITSVNSKTGDVVLGKSDVGLGNVDNVLQASKTEFNAHLAEKVSDIGGVHGLNIEVGTWTPYIFGTTTAGNNTYSKQFGKYIKENKKVTIIFDIALSAKDANMAGNIRIGGLPLAPDVDISYIASILGYNLNFATEPTTILQMVRSTAHLNLDKILPNYGTSNAMQPTEINNTTRFSGQITYYTN